MQDIGRQIPNELKAIFDFAKEGHPTPIRRFGVAGDSIHRQTGIVFKGNTAADLKIAEIEPLHPVPRDVKPTGYIDELAAQLKAEGFDRSKGTTDLLRMPDGHLRMANGNHHMEAMKRSGETTIPGRVLDWKNVPPEAQQWFRERFPDLDWPKTN